MEGRAADCADASLSRSSSKGKTLVGVMKTTDPNPNELAAAWLVATTLQAWEDYEAFASVLYQECSRQLPPGRLGGLLAGAENEVSQEACLMLIGGFLASNPNLIGETDTEQIQRHLAKSMAICVHFAKKRIARKRVHPLEFPTNDEFLLGTVNHPRCRPYFDLSFEEKRALAISALELAVKKNRLSQKNAKVARLSLEEGLRSEEIARRLGVSPSAICQQLTRVVEQLAALKECVEEEVL